MARIDSRPTPERLQARMKRTCMAGAQVRSIVATAKSLRDPSRTYEVILSGVFDGDRMVCAFGTDRAGRVVDSRIDEPFAGCNYAGWRMMDDHEEAH